MGKAIRPTSRMGSYQEKGNSPPITAAVWSMSMAAMATHFKTFQVMGMPPFSKDGI